MDQQTQNSKELTKVTPTLEGIFDFFKTLGYEQVDEGKFVKKLYTSRTMAINRQVIEQKLETTVEIKYIGSGWIEEHEDLTTLYGFSTKVNDEELDDVWVRDKEEAQRTFR